MRDIETLLKGFYYEPQTQTQSEAHYAFLEGRHLALLGYAGTGKTMLACALALEMLMDRAIDQINIFRSAVPSRDIGFLPGTEEEKMQKYEKSIAATFTKLLGDPGIYDQLKQKGIVNFCSTSFERGVTYDRSLMILDEVQNMSFEEIDTLMTRPGKGTRIILCGDVRQTDATMRNSGIVKARKILENKNMKGMFEIHEFGIDDIRRDPLVRSWIIATAEEEDRRNSTKETLE